MQNIGAAMTLAQFEACLDGVSTLLAQVGVLETLGVFDDPLDDQWTDWPICRELLYDLVHQWPRWREG